MKISVLKADQVCFIKLVKLLENEVSMINLHLIYTHTYFVLGTITDTNIKIDVDDHYLDKRLYCMHSYP